MTVRLNREVLYRGRVHKPGEPVQADVEMIALWTENGFVIEEQPPEGDTQPPEGDTEPPDNAAPPAPAPDGEAIREAPQAEQMTAPSPPGLVEGGSGAEGLMPGRDSRRKVR